MQPFLKILTWKQINKINSIILNIKNYLLYCIACFLVFYHMGWDICSTHLGQFMIREKIGKINNGIMYNQKSNYCKCWLEWLNGVFITLDYPIKVIKEFFWVAAILRHNWLVWHLRQHSQELIELFFWLNRHTVKYFCHRVEYAELISFNIHVLIIKDLWSIRFYSHHILIK